MVLNCNYDWVEECPPLPAAGICADQKCTKLTRIDYIDLNNDGIPDDSDGDGMPDEITTEYYKCVSKIGYYNYLDGFASTKIFNSTDPNKPLSQGKNNKTQIGSVFCWKKKGCPTSCEEATDPEDPTKTIWWCREPQQSGVNDPASAQSQFVLAGENCPD